MTSQIKKVYFLDTKEWNAIIVKIKSKISAEFVPVRTDSQEPTREEAEKILRDLGAEKRSIMFKLKQGEMFLVADEFGECNSKLEKSTHNIESKLYASSQLVLVQKQEFVFKDVACVRFKENYDWTTIQFEEEPQSGVYKVFEIREDKAKKMHVDKYETLTKVEIPAVQLGEKGRGRKPAVIPIHLSEKTKQKWQCGEYIEIDKVELTKNSADRWIFKETDQEPNNQFAIVIMKQPIGFRGSNEYYGAPTPSSHEPFTGKLIAQGVIAQGDAGRMGSGGQIAALVPKGEWFGTKIYGRRYGRPHNYQYCFDGKNIVIATPEERELLAQV